ncbi:hypothetical protein [Pandoraea thiooxydans]|uniref:hypothetical protein n=1 Tax=Pandoraea thiooxydans TaxID=445709 RepID=UPI0012EB9477|nr:hypothetical protein [Pandoraea thiooxydans]
MIKNHNLPLPCELSMFLKLPSEEGALAIERPHLSAVQLLKIIRSKLVNFTSFFASLRLQQRSEIIYFTLASVNRFLLTFSRQRRAQLLAQPIPSTLFTSASAP